MESSGIGQEKYQSYYTPSTTSSLLQSGVHNSREIKEVQVVAKLPSGSESSLKTLPCRLINGLPAQTLKLNHDDAHSKVFNEVVRRIKPSKQIKISEKISQVPESQLEKIVQCCHDPELILNGYHDFFTSDEFPYVNLRAFRDGKITVNEFATLASLHEIYKENRERNKSFSIKFKALFDPNGRPNRLAWMAIEETLLKTNSVSAAFKYNVADVIKKMKEKLATASPLEAGFWRYDMPKLSEEMPKLPEEMTITDAIRKLGSWALSRDKTQEMIPSITMIQAFIDSAYGEEAHRINPVIGVSSPDDIRSGSVGCFRDYAIPFPDVPLPKTADDFFAPDAADFMRHDRYHLERASLLTNADKDLYIAIGDALQEQKKQYDSSISKLKTLCNNKWDHITTWKDHIESLPEPQKKESMVKFQKELYKLSSLFSYLRRARKATGQLKFVMYDLEFLLATYQHESTRKELSEFNYHLTNILFALNGSDHEKSREILNGMPAKLAGRVVLPLIAAELDDPSKMYRDQCRTYDEMLRLNKDSPLYEQLLPAMERYRKFIDWLKFN